jgi:TusA-related sulfurtransferase
MEETITLNLEGEICPYTLVKTLKKIKEVEEKLKKGSILKVIVDHHPAVENIPLEVKKRGFQVEYQKLEAGKWEVIIKR